MYVFDFIPGDIESPVINPQGEIETNEDGTIKMGKLPTPYQGKIVVRAPTQVERLQYSKDLSLSRSNDGEINEQDSRFDQSIKMVEIAKKHVVSVDLTKENGSVKVSSVEELEIDSDATVIFSSIATQVIKGVKLGNGVRKQ